MPLSRRYRGNLIAVIAGLAIALMMLEVVCQLYAIVVYRRWDAARAMPLHYYRSAADPRFAYELVPGFGLQSEDGRVLHINRHGIRDDSNAIGSDRPRIAILGDSVTFGAGLSQELTIPRLLEEALAEAGTRARVLNFGVPGYASAELVVLLSDRDAIYDPDGVIYLMNANDFSRRNSRYEGADNGLYRMYSRPTLMGPWFIRKAIYRLHKWRNPTIGWYRWIYAGNRDRTFADIEAMARYAREQRIDFAVVLLPAGVAYGPNGTYVLSEMANEIRRFLAGQGIPHLSPVEAFSDAPARYFDDTDHLHPLGNERLVALLSRFVRAEGIGLLGEPASVQR